MASSSSMQLNIWSDEVAAPEQWVQLPSTSTRHRIATACVELAMAMLESPAGKDSLVGVAAVLLEEWDDQGIPHLYRGPRQKLVDQVTFFLRKVRQSFPNLYISVTEEGEASTVRYNWGTSLQSYDPVAGAHMAIHRIIIDNMIATRISNEAAYYVFKFQMSLAIAHEIIHLLTGFLTGVAGTMTPPDVSIRGFREEDKGEAGRYWEGRYLGGIVEFWADDKHELGNRQPGKPYLFADGHHKSVGKLVDKDWINRMLCKDFSFPIATAPGAIPFTRAMLRQAKKQETTQLRSKRRKRVPISSPPPGEASSIAYRRVPVERVAESHGRTPTQSSSASYRQVPGIVQAGSVANHRAPIHATAIAYRPAPIEQQVYRYSNTAPRPPYEYESKAYYSRR